MPWIGLECGAEAADLARWAAYLRGLNAGADAVADFLMAAKRLVSGEALPAAEAERMREIERRAAEAVERKRADVAAKAVAIVGKVMGKGVDPGAVLTAAGVDGWRAGHAGGSKNGGVANRARALRPYSGKGCVALGADGRPVAYAQKGKPAADGKATADRERSYGLSFEGWCLHGLRKAGFKMAHAARGVGLDAQEAWRCLSGWERHWRREGLRGVVFPGPKEGWAERFEESVRAASGVGLRGKNVVLNGGGKDESGNGC